MNYRSYVIVGLILMVSLTGYGRATIVSGDTQKVLLPGSTQAVAQAGAKRPVASGRGSAPTMRVALFPSLFEGRCTKFPDEARVLKAIEQSFSRNPEIEVMYSAYEEVTAVRELPAAMVQDLRDRTWQGILFKEPKQSYIYEVGKELEIDGVVAVFYNNICGTGVDNEITYYYIGIKKNRAIRGKYSVLGHTRRTCPPFR